MTNEAENLEQGISSLEAQRGTLGDAVVDAMLAPIRERLAALRSQQAHTEQRKQVTVLFADVSGFTALSESMDAEVVTGVMNDLWSQLDTAITAQGGQIDKHIGDCVMALWRVEETHEDDPERAIRAALTMQSALALFREEHRIQLAMRIGINTGPVLLGEVGSTHEFTAMGDTVNLASRLEQAAPVGGILISYDTYRHVRGVFDVQAQAPLTVKGKAAPVQTYIVLQAKPRAFRMGTRGVEGVETHMVGREAELTALQAAYLDAVEGGETRIVSVVGEAGVGKSRLLYEFENWIELRPENVYFFKGRASPALQGMPYGIVRDMFAYRFDILESDSAATALEKFRSGMAEILPDNHIDLVGHLIGFDFSTSPAVQKMIGSPDFGRLALTYLNNYVRALAARQPVMIFLEDLHWSDDSSLDLLESLVNAIPRVRLLLVGLLRPTLFERRPHWGEGQAAFGQLELKLLSRRASHALMEEILQKVDHVPDALRDLIIEGAEGNPYYMEELIKMLVDEGVIDRGAEAQNAWHISQGRLEQIRVPPTLTGILQARLDNLPHLEKNVLQRAAIVGKVFWDMLVAELAQEEHEKLDIALKSIRARELIFLRERSSFADTSEYIFKHALLRDVAYETVLLKLRRGYHAQVARWLEMHAGERIGEYAGLIAEHLEQAGQSSAAAAYLRQAGEKMMETGTLREALNFFRRALALLSEENLERGKLQVQIGDALMQLGNFGEAHQQLEAGLSTARLLGDKGTCAAALDNLGWIAREQGDWVQARLYLEDGLALARETNDRSRIAHILYTLSWVEVAQSKYTEAQAYLTESQSLFQSLNDRLGLTMVFNALGLVALGFNDYAQAQALHLQALALSREVVNRREEANILGNLGEDARICGDYGAARQYYQEGLTLCHEIGDKFGAARKIDNLGHTASAMGDYTAALGYYREALQIATDIGAVPMLLDILAGLAGVLAHTGQTEQSLELLGLALAHPGLVSDTKPIIEQTLTELRTLLSPVQIEAGMARGQALKLDTVVTELLRQAS